MGVIVKTSSGSNALLVKVGTLFPAFALNDSSSKYVFHWITCLPDWYSGSC
jgi:hypothetical protein